MKLVNPSDQRQASVPALQTEYAVFQKIDRGEGLYPTTRSRQASWNICDPPSLVGVNSFWRGEVGVIKVMRGTRPRGLGSPHVVEVVWHVKNLTVARRSDCIFKIAYARAKEIAQESNAGGYPDLSWPLRAKRNNTCTKI